MTLEDVGEVFSGIVGDPEVGEPFMIGKGVYFLCFIVCVMLRMYLQIYIRGPGVGRERSGPK